nr:MAG TPA: hypothetical protein [Caudoviricetes sp.]
MLKRLPNTPFFAAKYPPLLDKKCQILHKLST